MFLAWMPTIGATAGSVSGIEIKAAENAPAGSDKVVRFVPEMVAVPAPGAESGGNAEKSMPPGPAFPKYRMVVVPVNDKTAAWAGAAITTPMSEAQVV